MLHPIVICTCFLSIVQEMQYFLINTVTETRKIPPFQVYYSCIYPIHVIQGINNPTLFRIFHVIWDPKHVTYVTYLVSENHPFYVDLCTRLATQFLKECPPPPGVLTKKKFNLTLKMLEPYYSESVPTFIKLSSFHLIQQQEADQLLF